MAKLNFKTLRYQNIMSVGAEPVEIQLDGFKKTLITGVNGAGKSTMIEALCFVLFGKPFRSIKKGQLINSVNKKKLLVEVWFELDGKEFYIKRGQKPEVFEVHRDGQKIDESASTKDFQEYFEGIIGMNLASFKQIVVLGTAGYVPFMSLPAAGRRKLVEDLLDIATLGEMDKLNKAYVREITQNIQMQEMKANHVQQQINTHKKYIEDASKASAENLQRLQNMYEKEVESAKAFKAEETRLTDELLAVVMPEDPSAALAKINTAIAQIGAQIQNFDRVIHMHEKGGICPTCTQPIIQGNDQAVREQKAQAEHKLSLIDEKRVEYAEKANSFQAAQTKVLEIKRAIESQRANLTASVGRAKQIQKAIQELQKERVDNSEELAKLEHELVEITNEKSKLVLEKYHRGFVTEMLKDSGVKASIVKKYIPYFNDRIAYYLDIMEADYIFTLDEEFNETIKSRGRESFSYTSFSQGEKARIDLAMLFTWRDVAGKVSDTNISLLVLDEIYDGATDVQGVKALDSIIDKLDDNVYIISHRDHNPDDFSRHLKMVKRGRFTEMNVNI
ncbi:SbcC-like subunit of palindrome specific endonuclease [Escherichia phage ECD7]|uniref:Recombination endonuclease subunit n=1 Tax=Escherichia phage ECD7 TaxID=1981499 RepID=A0A220NT70_9CAUD|nr:SbcC-like subunit of palindrome specific endonuclease [Escherichia phage ECD7]ASJ80129.1 recombination endonuclease subunit [Escherichia phage ECD7]